MVRLGGRHSGSATPCFCADPCTHSVQDLNRLTCFRKFWNHGIWEPVAIVPRVIPGPFWVCGNGFTVVPPPPNHHEKVSPCDAAGKDMEGAGTTSATTWPLHTNLASPKEGQASTRTPAIMRFAISKPKFGLCRIECVCVCSDCLLSCLLYFVCGWGMLSDCPVGWCLDRASPEERVLGGNRPADQKPGDRLS